MKKFMIIVVMSVLVVIIIATGCSNVKPVAKVQTSGAAQLVQYTCPMHPEVISDKPGKCPKCGMELVVK
ncbi:MAG: heavy metal-binding domain-containing protein [bacterium]